MALPPWAPWHGFRLWPDDPNDPMTAPPPPAPWTPGAGPLDGLPVDGVPFAPMAPVRMPAPRGVPMVEPPPSSRSPFQMTPVWPGGPPVTPWLVGTAPLPPGWGGQTPQAGPARPAAPGQAPAGVTLPPEIWSGLADVPHTIWLEALDKFRRPTVSLNTPESPSKEKDEAVASFRRHPSGTTKGGIQPRETPPPLSVPRKAEDPIQFYLKGQSVHGPNTWGFTSDGRLRTNILVGDKVLSLGANGWVNGINSNGHMQWSPGLNGVDVRLYRPNDQGIFAGVKFRNGDPTKVDGASVHYGFRTATPPRPPGKDRKPR